MIVQAMMGMAMLLQGTPPASDPGEKIGEQIGQEVARSLQEAHVGEQVAEAMKQVPWHGITIVGALTGVLVPLGFFTLIGFLIWLIVRKNQGRTNAQLELQKQLLDKFTSGREFGEFLESKGGQLFLENALTPAAAPLGSSVRSIKTGTFLAVMGVGFLFLAWLRHGFLVAGFVLLAVGAGFLISGVVSHRLSEKWAQRPNHSPGPAIEPASQI